MKAIEVRKGSTMLKTTIVIWLVLLVLALEGAMPNRRDMNNDAGLAFDHPGNERAIQTNGRQQVHMESPLPAIRNWQSFGHFRRCPSEGSF
jgi:hypothetical protein